MNLYFRNGGNEVKMLHASSPHKLAVVNVKSIDYLRIYSHSPFILQLDISLITAEHLDRKFIDYLYFKDFDVLYKDFNSEFTCCLKKKGKTEKKIPE